MEIGQSNSGNMRAKEVHLELSTPINVQKGRAMVGRLETDKKLNREPLVSGFWVPRPLRDSSWVTIRYERLQQYCFDCGRLGQEERNCRFQAMSSGAKTDQDRLGKGLGSAHVKTIEEALVIHVADWDEAFLLPKSPSPAAGVHQSSRLIDGKSEMGRATYQVETSAIPKTNQLNEDNGQMPIIVEIGAQNHGVTAILEDSYKSAPQRSEHSNMSIAINSGADPAPIKAMTGNPNIDLAYLQAELTLANQTEITITKLPDFTDPTIVQSSCHPHYTLSPSPTKEGPSYTTENLQPSQDHLTPNTSEPDKQTNIPYYSVEFPINESEEHTAIVPFAGMSPISGITSGLNKIQIKRSPDLLEPDQNPNPPKKRLLFLEPVKDPPLTNIDPLLLTGPQKVHVRKLKRAIRGKKGKRQVTPPSPKPVAMPNHSPPLEPQNPLATILTPNVLASCLTADGCHQAAIGSP
ncbi:hypothetical protein K1719_011249 [Acacia pycnantha]|nr:hypothetical protein K1719_011249 [Acacia pycnantha]